MESGTVQRDVNRPQFQTVPLPAVPVSCWELACGVAVCACAVAGSSMNPTAATTLDNIVPARRLRLHSNRFHLAVIFNMPPCPSLPKLRQFCSDSKLKLHYNHKPANINDQVFPRHGKSRCNLRLPCYSPSKITPASNAA